MALENLSGLISIHAPLRGRQCSNSNRQQRGRFQSTPPCGGDRSGKSYLFRPEISIHAPLRGRRGWRAKDRDAIQFQSTPPCGGDRRKSCISLCRTISIHAPLRGRLYVDDDPSTSVGFQSTPPCGGDWGCFRRKSKTTYFNPRPLAGATGHNTWTKFENPISIHAPLRGRPVEGLFSIVLLAISIHAPLRGRLNRRLKKCLKFIFQSTPPCGGDLPG